MKYDAGNGMKYESESKGPVDIATMHPSHLSNAIRKLRAREETTNPLTPAERDTLLAMEARLAEAPLPEVED